MAKIVVQKCKESGYSITERFAKKWVENFPGDPNLAAAAAKYDIDSRTCFTFRE
jgi:hypothetical protein